MLHLTPRRSTFLAVALSLAVAGSAGAHFPTLKQDCGNVDLKRGHFIDDITAEVVSCRNARRLAKRFEEGQFVDYKCSIKTNQRDGNKGKHTDVKCKDGKRRAHFAMY
jgi:hypothetical protein